MKIRKIVSIVMALVLILSILPIGSLTSNAAWPKAGSETLSKTAKGGYGVCQIDFKLVNASSVSGDTATYYMDLYSMKTFKEMGNIYSATFTMNGCALSSGITVSKYSVTNAFYNNNTLFGTDNKLLTDTAVGGLEGDAPAVGETVEVEITASMTNTFKFNGMIFSDSCSVSAIIKIIVVDSSLLQARIGTGKLLKSSCWTSSTWSNYTDILSEAEGMVDGKTVSQNGIDNMLSRLDNARNALVHNGSITECEYCKNEKTGMTTTPISYRDVVYGTDKTRQCMDLFLPDNVSGDVSLILYLHGGGWISGDKSEYTGIAYDDCKKYGVATLTISYRYTSPSVNAFDIADDMAAALAKAKELGAKHGLNIKQMMTYGGSAGGHLALFYAYSRQNNSPIRPVAAFSECGPTNLTNKEYLDSNLGTNTIVYELSCMCGKTFTASTMDLAYNELAAISPVKYVNADTVPTVICHGKKDITVPFSDAETLDKFLTYYGVPHYFLAYPNTNHAIHIGTDPEYVEYAKKLFDQYVENYLKNINPAQVHDYETKTVPATSTSAGYTMYTCKICGEYHVSDISTVSHKAGAAVRENEIAATCTTEGSYDEVVYCTECGAEMSRTHKTISRIPHTPVTDKGYAATCTKSGKTDGSHCSVCGTVITAQQTIPAKGHTAGSAVRENEIAATCAKEGSYDEVVYCTVCGTQMSRNHKTTSKTAHTPVTNKGYAATCTKAGKTDGSHCSVCGTVITAQQTISATGHKPGDAVIENQTAVTCGQEGSYDEVVYCTVCSTEISRTHKTTEKLPHTPVTDKGYAATCTKSGKTDGSHCSVCGTVITAQQTIPAKGHKAGNAFIENEIAATCAREGSYDEVFYCTVCTVEMSRTHKTVSKTAHTPVIDKGYAATCTQEGKTDGSHCSVCGTVITAQQTIPAKGHKAGNAVIENEIAATCVREGSYDEVFYCTVCTVEISRTHKTVSKTSHTPVIDKGYEATCTQEGKTDGWHCSVCGTAITTQQTIPAKGHTAGSPVKENVIAPTCTSQGSYDLVYYCTVCSEEISRTQRITSKTSHTAGDWEVVTPATYDANGIEVRKCTVCGEVIEQKSIEKLTPSVEVKEGTDILIDETNMIISNIPQGTKDLSQYLDCKGCSLSYVETYNGFGTGTKVKAVSSDGVEVAEFTIVIEGDVTGDGYVDAFDLAVAGEYINTFTEPDEIAFIRAMDMVSDGYLDVIDMAVIINMSIFNN